MSALCFALIATVPCIVGGGPQTVAWPQFRGPFANGVGHDCHHPVAWSAERHVKWSAEIPGAGWSSPIVLADRVFVSTALGLGEPKGFRSGAMDPGSFGMAGNKPDKAVSFQIVCLRRSDGRQIWRQTIEERVPAHAIHASNTYATETPVTDGQRLVTYFGATGTVVCHNLEGKEQWRKNVGTYPTGANFGTGSSLSLDGHTVFLQCDNQQTSFLLALDSRNGEERWRSERVTGTSWSTPLIWRNSLRKELIVCGSGHVMSYDPATGRPLWKVTGIDSSFSASPATDAERVYFGNSGPGSRGHLAAVRMGASGTMDIAKTDSTEHLAWSREKSGPGLASPVSHEGLLYVVSRGILSCYDGASGERVYRERIPEGSSVTASPWIVDGKLFILDESGTTTVVKTGRQFEILGRNRVDGLFWSTPALSPNELFLRGSKRVYCIAEVVDTPATQGGSGDL